MRLVHAVLRDINGGDELDAVRKLIREGDSGIGLGLCLVIIHHHIEVATIHLINMVLAEEGSFCGVKSEVSAPIIDGIALVEQFPLFLTAHDGQQTDPYDASPNLHSSSGNWKSLLLLLPLMRI